MAYSHTNKGTSFVQRVPVGTRCMYEPREIEELKKLLVDLSAKVDKLEAKLGSAEK